LKTDGTEELFLKTDGTDELFLKTDGTDRTEERKEKRIKEGRRHACAL
jgi:hypothetical protein